MFRHLRFGVVAFAGLFIFAGCSQGLREQIRQRDFRAVNASKEQRAAASPISDVHDMRGWTTDMEGALAFARENGQNTALFFYSGPDQRARHGRRAMQEADRAIGSFEAQRAVVDLSRNPDAAASFGVRNGPALVVVGPTGAVVRSSSL